MAAEEHLIVFQGVQRSGNTLAVLPKQATQEHRVTGETMKPAKQSEGRGRRETARQNGQMVSVQRVAEIIELEAVLASRLQPAWGCAREAALPAAHSSRNGLYAI